MQKVGIILWKLIEKIIHNVLEKCCKLCKKELSDTFFDSVMQFLKFGIVGVSNTIISYLLYVISLLIFQKFEISQNVDYLIAQVIAFALSVLWSFYWNNKMVFVSKEGEKRSAVSALVKTYISYSFTGIFLNSILLVLWVQIFHVSEFIAPFLNIIINVPLNFLINKFWAFK